MEPDDPNNRSMKMTTWKTSHILQLTTYIILLNYTTNDTTHTTDHLSNFKHSHTFQLGIPHIYTTDGLNYVIYSVTTRTHLYTPVDFYTDNTL